MKECGTYKIFNRRDGKFYVGSSINIGRRFNAHRSLLRNNKHFNRHLQSAWNKYGECEFEFLYENELGSEVECICEEQRLLDKFVGKSCCYNTDKVAKLSDEDISRKRGMRYDGFRHSNETKQKMSLSARKRKTTKKMIEGRKRSVAALLDYRKTHRDLLEQKRIEGMIGSKKPDHWRQKMSKIMTGRVFTDEWKKKISESQKGVPKPTRTREHQEKINAANRGKKRSPESIEKLRAALKRYYEFPENRKKNSERIKLYYQRKNG